MQKIDTALNISLVGLTMLLALVAFPRTISTIEAGQQAAVLPAIPKDYFASTTIEAKAAYVYDLVDHKALYQKNESTALPLASLTKLMTAIIAVNTAPTSTIVTISPDNLKLDGDSGLYGNEKWSLDDLLSFTLVASSNDGAAAVAESLGKTQVDENATSSINAFVKQMNDTARRLGLTSSRFYNPTGLDIDSHVAGAYGSAKDVATLLTYAMNSYPTIIEPTSKDQFSVTSLSNIPHTALNTDLLVTKIPGIIAGKTGYTDLAGGNLAIAANVKPNHPVVVVVLGSSYYGRFYDVQKLLAAATETVDDKTR